MNHSFDILVQNAQSENLKRSVADREKDDQALIDLGRQMLEEASLDELKLIQK